MRPLGGALADRIGGIRSLLMMYTLASVSITAVGFNLQSSTAALALFDPQLIVLGPSAYVILDLFGATGYKVFALAYPSLLGLVSATLGYVIFRRGDLP